METNAVPRYDDSDNPTGCCPRFKPDAWDGQDLRFEDKAFIRATTRSLMHIPINMGPVFKRVQTAMDAAGAIDLDDCVVLSREISPWRAEHFFSTAKPVAGEESATLSGDFVTKVFEGPYREAKNWHAEVKALAKEKGGAEDGEVYFFYTTCPKCAKTYGENYVVGVARV